MDPQKLLYVSKVVHKAMIEVNEEGAEAAAGTGVVMMSRCMPIIMQFNCNKPFIYLISSLSDHKIMFMGKVVNPA
jgi:serpin B